MQLRERIKKIREYFHLTQVQMAEELGVERSYISKVESGKLKASDEMLLNLCIIFDLNPLWLWKGKGGMWGDWEWNSNNIMIVQTLFRIPKPQKAWLALYDVALTQLDAYKNIVRCLGKEILELTHPGIMPGAPVVLDVIKRIKQRIERDSGQGNDKGGRSIQTRVLDVMDALDEESLKDIFLLLASKAKRLDQSKVVDLQDDIAALEEASR